jgi:hypothetical protein
MAQTFAITAKNLGPTAEHLEEIGERSTQLRPIFDDLIDALIGNERTLWSRNGGGGKKRWLPNTKSTIAHKIAAGLDPHPMRATGALERSLTQKGAEGQIAEGGGTTLLFGTRIWYAQFSQNAKNPRRKRTILSLLPKTRKSVREIILNHIVHGE